MAYTCLARPAGRSKNFECKVFAVAPGTATDERFAVLTIPFDFPAGDKLDPRLQAQLQEQFNT